MKTDRKRYITWFFLFVILFTGCQAGPAIAQNQDPTIPPGLDPKAVRPYSGRQLQKADMKWEQIFTKIKRPAYLPLDPVALQKKLDQQPAVEPPLAAMFAYIQARTAWQEKRLFEARQHLQRALTLAPNSKHLLEMLAQLWGASGNQSRSTAYLQSVVKVDPLNLRLILQLGGYALDQDRSEDAIAIFEYVQKHINDQPEPDLALVPLLNYYLGAALGRAGYASAAIEFYRTFLTTEIQNRPQDPRDARRLELLIQQQGLLWRQMGDTYCQLQEYDQALEAYRTAVTVGVSSKIDIIRRLVYVCLKVDRPDLATQSAIEILQNDELDQTVADLIRFVAGQVPDRQLWIKQIQSHLNKHATDSQAVMLLLDLFETDIALAMVRDHLKTHAADQKAIGWLLDHLEINASDADLQDVLNVILTAMVTQQKRADLYSVLLVSRVTDQRRLQKVIDQLPQDKKTKALRLFLLAQTYARSSDLPQAQKLLEEAIGVDGQLTVARLRLAVLHMSLKQFDQADKVLEFTKDPSDPRVVSIRVRLLTQAKRIDDALVVLQRALELRPEDVNLILHKAQLQVQMGKVALAERTLLDALNMNPLAEPIYEVLFELYDQGAVPDSMEQYKRLMMRVLKTIPRSRVARMRFAEALSSGGENDRAQNMLLELLNENPQDYRVLNELLEMYRHAQMLEKADKLLSAKISKTPEDKLLLLVAQSHYQQAHQQDKWFKLTENIIRKFEEEPVRTLQLAGLYLDNNRVDESVHMLEACWEQKGLDKQIAMALVSLLSNGYAKLKKDKQLDVLFDEAIKRYPDHDADLLYTWALMQDRLAKPKRSEEIMLELLTKYPDHGPANNGLGYAWANQGKNLERARAMIQKAVDLEPNNSAYLDSLGWVFYKLGQFDKAVAYLSEAMAAPEGNNPVILNHLGDAQYRNGNGAKAIQSWQRAQRRLGEPDIDLTHDPELNGLDVRLKFKISAASDEKDVPVAKIGPPKAP
ncbi:MAG: tetratricopeptide repeat protein [Phycisphaeraceae bacterium]|nr:tetratricopeptide repeat protein [Phycisphaeraceae bacterium]